MMSKYESLFQRNLDDISYQKDQTSETKKAAFISIGREVLVQAKLCNIQENWLRRKIAEIPKYAGMHNSKCFMKHLRLSLDHTLLAHPLFGVLMTLSESILITERPKILDNLPPSMIRP